MLDDDRGNDIDVDNIDNGFFDIAHSVCIMSFLCLLVYTLNAEVASSRMIASRNILLLRDRTTFSGIQDFYDLCLRMTSEPTHTR